MTSGKRKKKPPEPTQTFWVPMEWTYGGGAFVKATTADEAREKAKELDDTEFHQAGAMLVDWVLTGEPRVQP